MKKNVMMRIASIMLVLVLMTSSVISGTFAKYVTSDNGGDKARVAKFGVFATVDGTLFDKTYVDAAGGNIPGTTNITVESTTEQLVAPGTQNNSGMIFTLTGTPEVSVDVTFTFEVIDGKEVVLTAGEYEDPTTADAGDKFTLGGDYYPVVFTLTKDGNIVAVGNVAEIQKYLTDNLNNVYAPNTNLANIGGIDGAGIYKLTWAWAYGAFDGVTDSDRADTVLGNRAAVDPTNATVNMDVKFTITVTQVD